MDDPTGTDWTDSEVDLIVADYFDMLAQDLAREPYIKSHRNAALQQITGRSRGSIEFKHQNISAALATLCLPWIPGYKPRANFQGSLIQGIERYLDAHRNELADLVVPTPTELAETSSLFFEAPPTLVPKDATIEDPVLERIVRKFDPAARDARNRALGERGEERVLHSERARLRAAGRVDLARKVEWTSQERGDGAGYDILSFDSATGGQRLLEVKTTSGHRTTPFWITENERLLSIERPDVFRLVRLYDFARQPKAFELVPPLENSVVLKATNYRAGFVD